MNIAFPAEPGRRLLYGLTKDEVIKAYEVLKTDAVNITDEPQSCPWLELTSFLRTSSALDGK